MILLIFAAVDWANTCEVTEVNKNQNNMESKYFKFVKLTKYMKGFYFVIKHQCKERGFKFYKIKATGASYPNFLKLMLCARPILIPNLLLHFYIDREVVQ